MANIAIVILTFVLVLVTGYYAWETHRIVEEMRRARSAQLLPKLVPTIKGLGGGGGLWRIVNVGPGPALDVDVQMTPEPGGQPRRWLEPVVMPGETHDFIPVLGEADGREYYLDAQTERFHQLHLTGSYLDVLGEQHQVDETFELSEWWEFLKAALHRFQDEWQEEVPKRLQKIEKHLEGIGQTLKTYVRSQQEKGG
jgi:hypothetical protein